MRGLIPMEWKNLANEPSKSDIVKAFREELELRLN